jgi:ABC-type phosphate/phosphonate transport system substrate-binding protein
MLFERPASRRKELSLADPFAALPMYDWPEVSQFWNGLWQRASFHLQRNAIAAPAELSRDGDHEQQWESPDLLVGQTCGWPFVSRLRDKVLPFARFDFGVCDTPGDYCSVVIAADASSSPQAILNDPQAIVAVNGFDSQSGFRALSTLVGAEKTLPVDRFLVTGSHRGSIKAVAAGRAAMATIDAVSFRLAQAVEPETARVAILARTLPAPGLPLITAPRFAAQQQATFSALAAAISDIGGSQNPVGLRGIVPAGAADYAVLARPPFGSLIVA